MEEIINLIAEKKFSLVTEILDETNSVDIANFLETLDNDRLLIVFRLLKTDAAAEVFSYVSPEKQREIIESASDKEITSIVNELFIDDTVDIIDEHIISLGGGSGSNLGTGGMATKLRAAQMATAAGCEMVIANGQTPDILYDVAAGKRVGTRFTVKKD